MSAFPAPGRPTLRVESDPDMTDALDFLRESAIDPSNTAELEINVIRSWRHERSIRSFSYWAPALIGAMAAAAALLAVIQVALSPVARKPLPVTAPVSSSEPPISSYSE